MTRTIPYVEVRVAAQSDAEAIARLAGELGYPSTAAQIRERLDAIEGVAQHATFVAVPAGGDIVGWIQVSEVRSLTNEPRAEIVALVVDSGIRGTGVGRRLVERGEAWAREMGVTTIGLHCNVIRERAHGFYLRLGYAVTKSQKVFRKAL